MYLDLNNQNGAESALKKKKLALGSKIDDDVYFKYL